MATWYDRRGSGSTDAWAHHAVVKKIIPDEGTRDQVLTPSSGMTGGRVGAAGRFVPPAAQSDRGLKFN